MKVIEKGRAQKGWAKEFNCTGAGNGEGGCGAKLLVEEGDLYHTHSSHYDGSDETYTTFRCPECGVQTDVKAGVPSSVRVREKEHACTRCNDTGTIDTGNGDVPCGCEKGDTAVFNVAGGGQMTGWELKRERRY